MSKVSITRSLLDDLAMSISAKSGEAVPLTLTEMKDAVDSIQGGGTPRTSTDLVVSGATVTAPAGVYATDASKSVASGTAGTPTATKGTVSNHSVSVTPSVTNTAGYISGGTINGTAVTVSASELVSGTYNVTSSGTKDVTNYASASVPSGTEGTPTATKGTVSNHSISVTPSVTNTGGYITGGTKTGTAVTVSASELASGNKAITQNGTGIDVVGYSTVSVNVAGAEYTRTVICPQQTVSPSSAMQQMTLTSSGLIEDAKDYIVTLDGVEWLTTCETLWSANYCIGDVRYFLEASPSSTIYPFGAICENGVVYACFATTGSHTIKIERLDFITGGTTLTTKNITANGTYNASSDSADGYSSVTVNVPSGSSKNTQVVQGTTRTTSSALTAIGEEMTVTKTGTYDVYWSAFRSSTSSSYTYGTQLYVGGTAYGTQNTTWSNHVQNNHLTGVSLTANEKIRVYGRNSRGSSYYIYAPTLVIVES